MRAMRPASLPFSFGGTISMPVASTSPISIESNTSAMAPKTRDCSVGLIEVLGGRERLHGLHPGRFRRARREVLAGYARELELRPIFRDDGEVLEREAAIDLLHRGGRCRLLGVDAGRLGRVDVGDRQPAHGARARALAALHLHAAALARRARDAALGDVGDDDVAVAGRLALVGEGLLDHELGDADLLRGQAPDARGERLARVLVEQAHQLGAGEARSGNLDLGHAVGREAEVERHVVEGDRLAGADPLEGPAETLLQRRHLRRGDAEEAAIGTDRADVETAVLAEHEVDVPDRRHADPARRDGKRRDGGKAGETEAARCCDGHLRCSPSCCGDATARASCEAGSGNVGGLE